MCDTYEHPTAEVDGQQNFVESMPSAVADEKDLTEDVEEIREISLPNG